MAAYGGSLPPRPAQQPMAAAFVRNYYLRHVPGDHRHFLLLVSAVRLADVAELQYSRMQQAVGAIRSGDMLEAMLNAQGEIHLLLIPLHRSLEMLDRAAKLGIPNMPALPLALVAITQTVDIMRHHFEHIDERALEQVKGKPHGLPDQFASAFGAVVDGKVMFGADVLDLTQAAAWLDELHVYLGKVLVSMS